MQNAHSFQELRDKTKKAKMTFTKTSQKFGQWIDFKLNFVYGLGFPNDSELNRFVDKFKEIKDNTGIVQKYMRLERRLGDF